MSGKFNTMAVDGYGNWDKASNHKYPYTLIRPGLVDGGNNFTYPCTHKWPAELGHILRPLYTEYIISNDLSWTKFTKKASHLEKYVSVANPCCCIEKHNGTSTEFLLTCFDQISQAFISNGEIHNKVIAIYLSATRCLNHSYAWRDAVIFLPGSEAIQKANELGLMVGIATFINSGSPTYKFIAISNPHLWDSCPTYRY